MDEEKEYLVQRPGSVQSEGYILLIFELYACENYHYGLDNEKLHERI